MKFLNIVFVILAFPLVAQADRLIYPATGLKAFNKTNLSLQSVSDQLKLGINAADYQLKDTRTSLLGKHEYYQKVVNGHEVEGTEVVITSNDKGEIVKVFNNSNSSSLKKFESSVPLISQNQALELAWAHLQVNGKLTAAPTSKLIYTRDMNLVYKVNLSVSSPSGHFDVIVDAHSGKVIEVADEALPRMKRAHAPTRLKGKAAFNSLSSALDAFNMKSFEKMNLGPKRTVNGTAFVFDPNPVVTLGRTDLQDDSPASAFNLAYTNETLLEITFANGVYSLQGPKVTLSDFESPDGAPSTSADGAWANERGNNAFNDAMTYYHIDQSIRYIESLGFTKTRVIFPKSLMVDADGVDGDDNSHYIPSSRSLAFGHGCVDDNEDADVILHELGHAIQHHINPNWMGGDTGAMGEGFGDYWAASYSAATNRGLDKVVNWVFKWDGHNKCWPGRVLNAYTPVYNPSRSYGPHTNVDGGVSDQLWSTPVFQAFLELYNRGVPRATIDKIILEAHFGLGSGVKIPEMAKAIVKTAKALFPTQNYDQVYLKHFQKMKIL